ncbi:hypothetical protein [Aeromicrobium sp. 179-A 4D2 NHS]|uniref:hypothetical protein n=1 Tax=Aeromicrobium sp. 179-A 4D2 NHS TaxID=3142375 RepID=UPI00399FB5E4
MIEKFVQSYQRQYDFWDALARKARGIIEAEIAGAGIQAIVTSRAKSVERLRMKVEQRARKRKYRTVDEIGRDISDLAGVRIALYFPSQGSEVRNILDGVLDVPVVKTFPDASHTRPGDPRFTGYRAQHYRGALRPDLLSDHEERYIGAQLEVQVASVLMHAWSEVEHDLVYKPLDGELSGTEYALLDQLNGLVQSGEIALEELLRARDQRIAQAATPFRSHYELAEFLRSQPRVRGALVKDSTMGSLDVLFEFLREESLDSSVALEPLLERLEGQFENFSLTDQIVDQIVTGDPARYRAYRRAVDRVRRRTAPSSSQTAAEGAMGKYVRAWSDLETVLFERDSKNSGEVRSPSRIHEALLVAARDGDLSSEELDRALRARRLRNELLHSSTRLHHWGPAQYNLLGEEAEFLSALAERLRRTSK